MCGAGTTVALENKRDFKLSCERVDLMLAGRVEFEAESSVRAFGATVLHLDSAGGSGGAGHEHKLGFDGERASPVIELEIHLSQVRVVEAPVRDRDRALRVAWRAGSDPISSICGVVLGKQQREERGEDLEAHFWRN